MKTVAAPLSNIEVFGILYIAQIAPQVSMAIRDVQRNLDSAFPGLFWFPSPSAMHVTFLNLISSEKHYLTDTVELYDDIWQAAHTAMLKVAQGMKPVVLSGPELSASAGAVIVKWHDDGAFDLARAEFTSRFQLPAETRRPPVIVHTTIARYLREHDLDQISGFVQSLKLEVTQTVSEIVLVRESQMYLQRGQVLETYHIS